MKKIALAALLATSLNLYGSSNIIDIHKLMLYSIVEDTAVAQIEQAFPEYSDWLSDTDALLLLNYLTTCDKMIILKFSADWCMPCKRLAPIVRETAQECSNDIIVIEIDIDNAPTLRDMFSVSAVPTLIYFKNGRQVDRTHGVSKETLLDKIQKIIAVKSSSRQ